MKLVEFEEMWRNDPNVESLTKEETNEHDDGVVDILFHVLYRNRMVEYGRHAGLRVRINRTLEVISHDIFNMTIDQMGNWVEVVTQWFNNWYYSNTTYTTAGTTSSYTLNYYNTTTSAGY